MESFIDTRFIFIIIISIVGLSFAFAINDSPNEIDTEKYSLVFISLPTKTIRSQEKKPGWKEPVLQIYCFQGVPRHWLNTWISVSMEISLEPEDYYRYDGLTPREVVTAYEEQNIFWSLRLFSWKDRIIRANPDGGSCVGIRSTKLRYEIYLYSEQIDYWKPALLLSGIILYLMAPKLSQNTLFYYLCGIILGLCASILVLVYFANRLVTLPQGPVMFYGFLAASSFVGLRIMQMLWENIRVIVTYQWSALVTYMAITSLLSVAICYRMGPVQNPRTRNLIQWAMQIVSLYLMYLSSEFQDAVIVIITLFLIFVNFPRGFLLRLSTFWRQQVLSSAPRRLLTEEEYRREGVTYTSKSLEELRSFCASPACNQWVVVNNLKVPSKVAVFVTGSPHISEEERKKHRLYCSSKTNNMSEEVSDDSDF